MILNKPSFDFLEKGLGIVFPPYYVYYFSRKMLLMLFCLNWPNFMVGLPSALGIMDSMCTVIVCFQGCDVINLKINLIFLIKQKSQDKNWNILRTKRALKVKKKAFFITFQGLSQLPISFSLLCPGLFPGWFLLVFE